MYDCLSKKEGFLEDPGGLAEGSGEEHSLHLNVELDDQESQPILTQKETAAMDEDEQGGTQDADIMLSPNMADDPSASLLEKKDEAST